MLIGSLFSGIGGIELGFEAEGFETIWFVECDLYAQSILRKHWPGATIYGDITVVDWTTVPKVDILTGGFPCQDISNVGKRAGITGSRSSLWKYYRDAIREMRPKYAIIENVAALRQRGLDVVLTDLAEIGYDAEWYNLSASAVGAPHRRERIFIVAYPNKGGLSTQRAEQQTAGITRSDSQNADVANTFDERQSRKGQQVQIRQELFCTREHTWATEPELGRVAHGVPNRVDRIKCLGNAVVPQCAQIFAQAIKEYERER